MNRHLYRIVFNKKRGLLMAVAECATGDGKSAGTGERSRERASPASTLCATLRGVAFGLFLALGMAVLVPSAFAQIVAYKAAPASQRPTVLSAGNGVPLVNIQTPSAAGVSRNTYEQFDVASQGAILNNSRNNAQTQLGGWVQGNPWLAAGTARAILNEVVTANPSQLLGHVEIAGSKAEVVIANPAGVTCNGCGFINASRATLTTGTPVVNGGNLDGYRVTDGTLRIEGAGMNATGADATALIARAVEINAGLWANDLKITTGANAVDADNQQATPIPPATGSPVPAFAIDVARLGGMYAGKIVLVGTETGVGVRNAGHLGAGAGNLVVTSDGKLINSGTLNAAGSLRLDSAAGIEHSGTAYAGADAGLSTRGNIANSGIIAAQGHLALTATGATSRIDGSADAILAAGMSAEGTLTGLGHLTVEATEAISLHGKNVAGGDQALTSKTLDLADSTTSAAKLTLKASNGDLDADNATISASDTLSIDATQDLRIAGSQLAAGRSLELKAAQLNGTGQLLSLQDLSLILSADTTQTGTITANRNAVIKVAGVLNNDGTIQAGNTLDVSAGTLTNRGRIDGGDTFIDTITLNNLGTGRLYGDHLAIAATTLNNHAEGGVAPVIAARGRLDIGAGMIDNRDGAWIFSAGDLSIGGALDSAHHTTGRSAAIANTGATIEATGHLSIDTTRIVNQRKSLTIARGTPQGTSSRFWVRCDNPPKCSYYTEITETTNEYLDTVSDKEESAFILSGGNMRIASDEISNRYSIIETGGDLVMTGSTLTNEGAELYRRVDVITSEHRWHRKNGLRDHGVFAFANSTSALTETVPAIISANGTLTGSFTGQIDNIAIRQNTAPASQRPTSPTVARIPLGNGQSVVSVTPSLTFPRNSLYRTAPASNANYLIETDPRFASYRQWISSDYMLNALSLDPASTQKRLGDGFYEQRLVTEQIGQLTGRRFLAGYADDESQYRALMEAGVSMAKEWNIRPGVALSDAQIAQLTTDIVWLVEREVTLADGSTQKALVPQVYARVRDDDLTPSGALLAGASVNLSSSNDLISSGRIAGRQLVTLTAENLRNLGEISGKEVFADARTDLQLLGGQIVAEKKLVAQAGRDLSVASSTVDLSYGVPGENGSIRRTDISRVAGLYVTGDDGTLVAASGRDMTLLAAALTNGNASSGSSAGTTVLAAGGNLTLGTVTESRDAATQAKRTRWSETASNEVGSTIQTAGDLTLLAGQNLSARAASVEATGSITARAVNDLIIEAGAAHYTSDYSRKSSRSGLFSKKSKTVHDTLETTTALSSTFSGDTVILAAGNDLTVRGSAVSAAHDLTLAAGRDVVIDTAQDTSHETHARKEKSSGLSSSWGGISYGKNSLAQNSDSTTVTQVTSTLSGETVALTSGRDTVLRAATVLADHDLSVLAGRNLDVLAAADTQVVETHLKSRSSGIGLASDVFGKLTIYDRNAARQDTDSAAVAQRTALLAANTGDLTLRAGLDNQYKGTGQGHLVTQGADLLAGDAITLSANALDLQAAANTTAQHSVEKTQSFTVGARLAGVLGSLINAVGDSVKAAHDTDNDRLQGAYALKAGYDAYKVKKTLTDVENSAADKAAAGIPEPPPVAPDGTPRDNSGAVIGVQVYVGSSRSQSESRSLETTVTGTNLQAKAISLAATETDLSMAAAKLQAEDIALSAARDVLLTAAANTSELASQNKGRNAGFGVTFGFGSQNGISIQLSASQMQGKANGSETVWDNTQIAASDTLTVRSGRDTTLKGAQLAGDSVLFDVGGNLLIETLQDESRYASKQSSSGFDLSLCIPPICFGAIVQSASFSASSQKIKHAYQSAVGQSGIAAGDGGFDITVGRSTELVGAAITSAAEADKNTLSTESLTRTDLTNTQTTQGRSSSVSVAYGKGGSVLGTVASSAAASLVANLNGNAALPKNQNKHSETKSVISPATITITGTGKAETDARSRELAEELMARDPETANQSLSNTLTLQQAQVLERKIQEQKENQVAAQLVGAVLANAVGDFAQSMRKEYVDAQERKELDARLASYARNGQEPPPADKLALARLDREGMSSEKALATLNDPEVKARADAWAEGSLAKTALHGMVGLISAKVAGGNAAAGALGGMTQETLAPELSEYLDKELGIKPGSADYAGLMQLGTTLAGTAIGAAGGSQGAASGATSALVGVANNFLKHDEAEKRAAAERKLLGCGDDKTCQREAADEINKWNAIDAERDQAMAKACLSPSSAECLGWYSRLYEAQMSYVGANVTDYSILAERRQITQQAAEVSQRINNAAGYNIAAGAIKSVAGVITGPAELLALTGKALTGDEQAQDTLKKIADAVGTALAHPVDTIQQGIKNQIDLANQLETQGRFDEATQLRSQLVTDGVLTVAGLGTVAVKGTSAVVKLADNLATLGIDQAYLKLLKLDAGAIKGFKSADDINALMTSAEWSPAWKPGTAVAETILQPGTKVRMVVSESQYIAITEGKPAFGGFASLDDIPSQHFAQNRLAITVGDPALGAMKSDLSYVVELRVKQPINAQVGVVGPQELGSQKLPGGGNQVHFIVSRNTSKAELFEFISGTALSK